MLSITDIEKLVLSRLADAEALFSASRYDGAIYLCGYAIELKLKSRICKTLGWKEGFPSSNNEFRELSSFKTHNLDILLKLSGKEIVIREMYTVDWLTVSRWNPESRYNPSEGISHERAKARAEEMIKATKNLMEIL